METIKVLLFAASPRGAAPLDLPREFREIDEEVRMSPHRAAVELILVPGTRPVDLLRKLNENRPQVVHFSSHGEPGELILESGEEEADEAGLGGALLRSADERDMKRLRPEPDASGETGSGQPHRVGRSALVDVLRSCDEGNLRLVVLNACHTRTQAEALTEVVDCVVSMNRAISDRAAIKFAASFYGALAYGRSVRTAFEQGLARLSAEGISETDTPELLVRRGCDASQVVLVRPAPVPIPVPVAPPAAEVPFLVPFPLNADFVGRDGDLARLHATLSGADTGPVGIRPAGLTGMGGIGKTQLAVEYVHRHRDDYPDGIFWIDAAGPLAEGFARLTTDSRLRWAEADRPRDEQIRAAFAALNGRPRALLVLDNLPDPAAIAVPLVPGCTPEDLRCRLLFTTRRHDLGRFAGVEVTVLPEEPALRLLLRHPSHRAALDPAHPDHEHARAIARMLGRLPLALELAGAYLGKYSGDVSLEGYREGLRSYGALATLDADAAELTEADLRRVHDPAVAATIGEQWEALRDESARLLLRVASLFPESAAVPIARLGLLAGLDDDARPGRPSPLRRAIRRLDDACLIERLESDEVRLHPLIREFARGQISPDQVDDFRDRCLERAAAALEQFPSLEAQDVRRGVDALQEDLIAILELCPPSSSDRGAPLLAILRLLQREAEYLRLGDAKSHPTLFAQRVRNRAVICGISTLESGAEQRLDVLGEPHFRLLWTARRESPALIRTLTRHHDWIGAITTTRDGLHALSGSDDRTLKLWDLRTGRLLRSFVGHEAAVSAVAASPDGRSAISASHDGKLKLWDLHSGQLLRDWTGHEAGVAAMAVTPDGRLALLGSYDRTLSLLDLETGQVRQTLVGHEYGVSAVVITPDARLALSGSYDRTLRLWDLGTGRLLRTFAGHEDKIYAVAMTPDGRHAISGSQDRTLRLWEVETGRPLRCIAGHRGRVSALALTPDGLHAISGSYDETLRLWDLQTGQLCQTLAGHEGGVRAVAITPDGRRVISASFDLTLKLWDLRASPQPHTVSGHDGPVRAVAITPDGNRAVSGSNDGSIRLWDLRTGQLLHTWAGHDAGVSAVAITPAGDHVLSGSDDRTLKLWDLETGRLIRSFVGHDDWVDSIGLTRDGRYAVSGSYDCTIRLWDLQTGRLLRTIAAHERGVLSAAVRLWDLQTGRLLRTIAAHERGVLAVVVTPDGSRVLSASRDRTFKLWELETGRLIHSFDGHEDGVSAVAVSPDGRLALSASRDRTLRLWDLRSGRPLRSCATHEGSVYAVGVTSDGRLALSGSEDSTLQLWDLHDGTCCAMTPLESSALAIAVSPDGQTIVVGDRVGSVHCFRIHTY
jgi:WD40 repeat protein